MVLVPKERQICAEDCGIRYGFMWHPVRKVCENWQNPHLKYTKTKKLNLQRKRFKNFSFFFFSLILFHYFDITIVDVLEQLKDSSKRGVGVIWKRREMEVEILQTCLYSKTCGQSHSYIRIWDESFDNYSIQLIFDFLITFYTYNQIVVFQLKIVSIFYYKTKRKKQKKEETKQWIVLPIHSPISQYIRLRKILEFSPVNLSSWMSEVFSHCSKLT